jgi:phosphotriesterase-related protein
MLGLDAARRGYWSAYGGGPGMAFLLGEFSERMAAAGVSAEARRRIFIDNPARAFAFRSAVAALTDPTPARSTSES